MGHFNFVWAITVKICLQNFSKFALFDNCSQLISYRHLLRTCDGCGGHGAFWRWSFQNAGAMSVRLSSHVRCVVFQATIALVQSYLPYFVCRNTRLEYIWCSSCSYRMICQPSSPCFSLFCWLCWNQAAVSKSRHTCFWWHSSEKQRSQ